MDGRKSNDAMKKASDSSVSPSVACGNGKSFTLLKVFTKRRYARWPVLYWLREDASSEQSYISMTKSAKLSFPILLPYSITLLSIMEREYPPNVSPATRAFVVIMVPKHLRTKAMMKFYKMCFFIYYNSKLYTFISAAQLISQDSSTCSVSYANPSNLQICLIPKRFNHVAITPLDNMSADTLCELGNQRGVTLHLFVNFSLSQTAK